MRIVALMLALALAASPALADEAESSPVVILRGSSAPPTPQYQPPQPEVQTVYVPVYYYPVWLNGRIVPRHHHAHAAVHSSTRGR
ncbi:MAG: hypothetical protein ISP45_32195 [Reyranella sp.]|nr:hypothetical protein [Reyranella sp.]